MAAGCAPADEKERAALDLNRWDRRHSRGSGFGFGVDAR